MLEYFHNEMFRCWEAHGYLTDIELTGFATIGRHNDLIISTGGHLSYYTSADNSIRKVTLPLLEGCRGAGFVDEGRNDRALLVLTDGRPFLIEDIKGRLTCLELVPRREFIIGAMSSEHDVWCQNMEYLHRVLST